MFDRDSAREIFRLARTVIARLPARAHLLLPGASLDYIHEAIKIIQPKSLTPEQITHVPYSGKAVDFKDMSTEPLAGAESSASPHAVRCIYYGKGALGQACQDNVRQFIDELHAGGITMKAMLAKGKLVIADYVQEGVGTAGFVAAMYDMAKQEGCEKEFVQNTSLLLISSDPLPGAYAFEGTPLNPDAKFELAVDSVEGGYPYPSRIFQKRLPLGQADLQDSFRITPQKRVDRDPLVIKRHNIGIYPAIAKARLRMYYRGGEPS